MVKEIKKAGSRQGFFAGSHYIWRCNMGLFSDGFKELKKADVPLYRAPKSIQETIEIMSVAENGIFEVGRGRNASMNKYSK